MSDGVRRALADQTPLLRRAIELDAACLARIRVDAETAAVFARLPFGVLVARTVSGGAVTASDRTMLARELLDWLEGDRVDEPAARDADWRGGLPPATGWRRVDSVPDTVVRELVRTGAAALRDAADRAGVPGAEPRAEVADALLDSVVLTVTADGAPDRAGADPATADRAEVTLRSLSALTRMGFLARGSAAHVDVSGRWTRVVAAYGTVFAERPGLGLGLLGH
ncbi:MAG: hypothetical protein ABI429_06440 [Jatrophihabitantaceae bacterium]